MEQSHRAVKARYYPTFGFRAFESAKRFCETFYELHQYFKPRLQMTEFICLLEQRDTFRRRAQDLKALFIAA